MIDFNTLGIPEELFNAVKDKAVKVKIENGLVHLRPTFKMVAIREPHPTIPNRTVTRGTERVWTHRFIPSQKNHEVNLEGLNFIYAYVCNGYKYSEKIGSKYYFYNDFTDKTVYYDEATGIFGHPVAADKTFDVSYPIKTTGTKGTTTSVVNFSWTNEQLATLLNTSVDKVLQYRSGWQWVFETVEENEIANGFGDLTVNEEKTQVNANLLINLKPYTEFNNGALTFTVDWYFYNEDIDLNERGENTANFGEGGLVENIPHNDPRALFINLAVTEGEPFYDAATHTFHYNEGKEILVAFVPKQGRQREWETLIDVKTGKVYHNRLKGLQEAV